MCDWLARGLIRFLQTTQRTGEVHESKGRTFTRTIYRTWAPTKAVGLVEGHLDLKRSFFDICAAKVSRTQRRVTGPRSTRDSSHPSRMRTLADGLCRSINIRKHLTLKPSPKPHSSPRLISTRDSRDITVDRKPPSQ
jgi:hypothetical protein